MNSGQIVSTTSASTCRSGEPFCVTIGNTTRWRMPSTRCRCGWNSTSESRKSGTPNPSACHRRKSATDAARYAASCGNRGASASIDSTMASTRADASRLGRLASGTEPSFACSDCSAVADSLRRSHAGSVSTSAASAMSAAVTSSSRTSGSPMMASIVMFDM